MAGVRRGTRGADFAAVAMTYPFRTRDRAREPSLASVASGDPGRSASGPVSRGGTRPRFADVTEGFDPVAEGARHDLRPAVAREIWDGACSEATDPDGQRDEWQARQRFHAVVARVMARGGWLRPAAGVAHAGVDLDDGAFHPWSDELARRAGRQPRVVAEALRRSQHPAPPASPALDPGTPRPPAAAPRAQLDRAQALDAASGDRADRDEP
jgi:hypothetical protein